jgi:hypothetical protein
MLSKLMRSIIGLTLATMAVSVTAQNAAEHKSTFFEQAKITVNERARAEGFLRVRLQPENGEAREATIDIPKRMSENDIAKTLAAALKAAVGPDYNIDRDAGEHVKIRKAKRDAPNFSVEITFSAPGFAIILDN